MTNVWQHLSVVKPTLLINNNNYLWKYEFLNLLVSFYCNFAGLGIIIDGTNLRGRIEQNVEGMNKTFAAHLFRRYEQDICRTFIQ